MENADRLIILIALSAGVIWLIAGSSRKPVVGSPHDKIPTNKINVSDRHNCGAKPGPLYLLSNLPAWRRGDDALPIIADGSVSVSVDGVHQYGD
jgi:hypothetical protein